MCHPGLITRGIRNNTVCNNDTDCVVNRGSFGYIEPGTTLGDDFVPLPNIYGVFGAYIMNIENSVNKILVEGLTFVT